MKVLSFAASNSRKSINRSLVAFAAERLRQRNPYTEIEFLDLNDYEMLIYSPDREAEGGVPGPARAFYDKIGAANAVLISFAEHNGAANAAWKNVFDWMSRIDMAVWQNKPLVLLAASPGSRAGSRVLASQEVSIPFAAGDVKAKHGIGEWRKAWNADARRLTRDADVAAIDRAIACLAPQHA